MKRVLGKGLEALIPTADTGEPKSAVETSTNTNDIHEIPIAKVKPSPFQPRVAFDPARLSELAQSISTRGVIQPIVVRARDGGYELIVGERRLRAMELLGRTMIPAIVYDILSNEEAMELTLIENIQRENLNPIEEAGAYHRLLTEFNLSQADLAARVGKERSSISNAIRLLSLPSEIQELISGGKLSAGHARALLTLATDSEKITLAQRVVAQEMSVRDLEKLVYADKPTRRTSRIRLRSAQVQALEEELKKKLGTKVMLTQRKKGGRITIEYYSNDELERLLAFFGFQG
jgi:ParB family transcriptional regulator, chromosome partitioning protein